MKQHTAGKTRKRTPEEIRTVPAKGTARTAGRQQRQVHGSKSKPGGALDQDKRSTSRGTVGAQGIFRSSRQGHRVASTTKKSVMFSLDAPSGLIVSVAGSFNDWKPKAMTKGPDGLWHITVQLAQGTYEYRFLVDTDWREDPANPRKAQNELGGYNSICKVL